MNDHLKSLAAKWRRRASRKFADAKHETGMARRALEHAAICELNCAEELANVAASFRVAGLRTKADVLREHGQQLTPPGLP